MTEADWEPIGTAPKDGTEILAVSADGLVFITAWLPSQCDGWGVIHSCCGYYEDQHPTHWMRLPRRMK